MSNLLHKTLNVKSLIEDLQAKVAFEPNGSAVLGLEGCLSEASNVAFICGRFLSDGDSSYASLVCGLDLWLVENSNVAFVTRLDLSGADASKV